MTVAEAAKVDNRRGAMLLIAAAAVFTADVAVLRALSDHVSNGQIVFFRLSSLDAGLEAWTALLRDLGRLSSADFAQFRR